MRTRPEVGCALQHNQHSYNHDIDTHMKGIIHDKHFIHDIEPLFHHSLPIEECLGAPGGGVGFGKLKPMTLGVST